MAKNIVGALVSAGLMLAAVAEDRLPSLESPCLHGAGGHISKLAALAGTDGKVVAFLGDGGAQMTAEELMVASELKLPVAFMSARCSVISAAATTLRPIFALPTS